MARIRLGEHGGIDELRSALPTLRKRKTDDVVVQLASCCMARAVDPKRRLACKTPPEDVE